ncbi:related to Dynein intermediate chain 1, cytosolic [Sporisorium reilianum SRZ2]|uniref:Related to Dynein intermediate chain 1, cytosolic n=1 Tax=Sporisorium reilianum (strain SRZ2) TaxID=999809 RepID=E6ZP66_SPORE|nr:related to Dynein intermediate chain 1, cytosolic [Sporisorium reilianum SRZ2]
MSSSSSSASEARRKAEIEAKKAKLLEIRRQREERAQRLKSTSAALPESSTTASSRRDLDDLVNSLISGQGATRSGRASVIGDPSSPRKSVLAGSRVASVIDPPSSEFGGSDFDVPPSTPGAPGTAVTATTTAVGDVGSVRSAPVELIDVETELFELPQKQRVFYTKEVQTAAVGDSDDEYDGAQNGRSGSGPSGGVGAEARIKETEESLRAKILAEHQADLAARQEEERLEREIAQQLRELTDDERLAIYSAQDFSDFVEHSSKIVERALTDTYDYMRDYRISADDSLDALNSGSQLRIARKFGAGDKTFANRSITAMDWSTKYPELCVVAYNRNDQDEDAPDGLVAVWNMHLGDRPEFVFHAQTDVLSVCFSPFHPNLVVGGTYSGQILIWDTRARSLPVLKTPLSAAGHTHPVYGLKIIGSANAHNLVSASTDGTICWWMLDMLARPQETLELVNTLHPKTDEVAVTSLGLVDQETTSFLVGSEDGHVYAGNRYDRAGLKAGLNMNEVYRGHVAPITGIHFHPLNGGAVVDFSDLFLTSSMDWTSKLWRLKPASSTAPAASSGLTPSSSLASGLGASRTAPSATASGAAGLGAILSFEESNDYIYDVGWSPTHPAVFAQVDGTGRLDVFNLNVDTERPVASITPTSASSTTANGVDGAGDAGARALNKVAWARTGRKVAVGGSDGVVYVYDVNEALAVAGEDEFTGFQGVLACLLSASAGAGGASAVRV